MLHVGFVRPVKRTTWLSRIIVVPNKNGKMRVCIYYWNLLDSATITNASWLPFTDSVLDAIARNETYNFLDGFSGYNQIRMHPDDQEKTTFFMALVIGGFYGVGNGVRIKNDTDNFLENYSGNIWGLYSYIHVGILGWLCHLYQESRSFGTFMTLFIQMLFNSSELKFS